MQKHIFLYLLMGVLTISCSSSTTPEITLQITNPMDQKRNDAIIKISRGEIGGWITIPEGQLPVLKDLVGNYIPCQADDLDGDGEWDELFALDTLEAKESKKIVIGFVLPEDYPEFQTRTNLHLGDARNGYKELNSASRLEGITYHNYAEVTEATFQMEGVGWENDLVGFRNYMDQRNGMDIFGKTTSDMVLDKVGQKGEPSYHEPAEWGMDVLKVGTSFGAGGIGYMYKDSIYRVGDTGSGTYEVRYQGPVRSRFVLNYSDWEVEDQILQVNHHIGIAAGRHFYQSIVQYTGTEDTLDLVIGIVNMLSEELTVLNLNDQYTGLYTLDHQSEDGSLLTMALVVPSSYLVSTGETRNEGEGVIQTYYAILDASPGDLLLYRFYSLWEKENPKWNSREAVESYLKAEAERLTQSIVYAH